MALWAGASSGRPPSVIAAQATGPCKVADAIVVSIAVQRWPQQGAVWREPDPGRFSAGAAENHAGPQRARAAARVLRGAQRAQPRGRLPFSRHCFLPPPLALAAGLRGVPALPAPGCGNRILTRAAWCHFTAGDGRRCLVWK